ncbi:MAG TPA: hypothetical protein VMT00_15870 [Thermoanaerobaculia bacterium]|nr:hypothetical protein [Thermoanaerobaculia bacterium]
MSSAGESQANFPTMIIPRGTEIKLNSQGQLSIKTPGNLVIQNSGTYSELESTNGSIRIEDNVSVEAVSVRAGQACFIQGTLTAWRVHAKRIALEDRAKAYIMLQESEQLELSKGSRLVGNFANEKEIFLLLGKFTSQLKELPGSVNMTSPTPLADSAPSSHTLPGTASPRAGELPEPLRDALVLLEGEVQRRDLDPQSSEALREVVFALREKDVQRTAVIYREAFSELTYPSEVLKKVFQLLDGYFQRRG